MNLFQKVKALENFIALNYKGNEMSALRQAARMAKASTDESRSATMLLFHRLANQKIISNLEFAELILLLRTN